MVHGGCHLTRLSWGVMGWVALLHSFLRWQYTARRLHNPLQPPPSLGPYRLVPGLSWSFVPVCGGVWTHSEDRKGRISSHIPEPCFSIS